MSQDFPYIPEFVSARGFDDAVAETSGSPLFTHAAIFALHGVICALDRYSAARDVYLVECEQFAGSPGRVSRMAELGAQAFDNLAVSVAEASRMKLPHLPRVMVDVLSVQIMTHGPMLAAMRDRFAKLPGREPVALSLPQVTDLRGANRWLASMAAPYGLRSESVDRATQHIKLYQDAVDSYRTLRRELVETLTDLREASAEGRTRLAGCAAALFDQYHHSLRRVIDRFKDVQRSVDELPREGFHSLGRTQAIDELAALVRRNNQGIMIAAAFHQRRLELLSAACVSSQHESTFLAC